MDSSQSLDLVWKKLMMACMHSSESQRSSSLSTSASFTAWSFSFSTARISCFDRARDWRGWEKHHDYHLFSYKILIPENDNKTRFLTLVHHNSSSLSTHVLGQFGIGLESGPHLGLEGAFWKDLGHQTHFTGLCGRQLLIKQQHLTSLDRDDKQTLQNISEKKINRAEGQVWTNRNWKDEWLFLNWFPQSAIGWLNRQPRPISPHWLTYVQPEQWFDSNSQCLHYWVKSTYKWLKSLIT